MYRELWPLVAACFHYIGLTSLVRWVTRWTGKRVIILCYHGASPNLRSHILYLQRHYRIVPLEAALQELYAPTKASFWRADRRTLLALTFDDGSYDAFATAYPLARELGFPFTIFLIPGYMDTGRRFWWLEGEYLARHAQTSVAVVEDHTYHLDKWRERRALAHVIDTRVRHARSVSEREAFLHSTREALGVPAEVPPTTDTADALARPLGWSEAREMESSGWVSYGAHTMHHPILSELSDIAETQREVSACRATLEQQLGHEVRAFAYPVGRWEDIGAQGLDAVQRAGYSWAVTTTPGFNSPDTHPYLLRRICTDTSEHWWVLAAQTAGVWTFLSPTRLWRMLKRLRWRNSEPTQETAYA